MRDYRLKAAENYEPRMMIFDDQSLINTNSEDIQAGWQILSSSSDSLSREASDVPDEDDDIK